MVRIEEQNVEVSIKFKTSHIYDNGYYEEEFLENIADYYRQVFSNICIEPIEISVIMG